MSTNEELDVRLTALSGRVSRLEFLFDTHQETNNKDISGMQKRLDALEHPK